MKVGDYVYYYASSGDTVPACVLAVKGPALKIRGNFLRGRAVRWVFGEVEQEVCA